MTLMTLNTRAMFRLLGHSVIVMQLKMLVITRVCELTHLSLVPISPLAGQGELFCLLKCKTVDGMPRKCAKERCSKQSSYGVSGSRKREYCAEHASEGMVNLSSRKCAGNGCSKGANYGVPGTRMREYCVEHALEGMYDISSRKCAEDGCSKRPNYGVPGSTKPEYCAGHALEGMVDVCSKKCAGVGCSKQPNYGVSGSRKREYCAKHALEGMICIFSRKCAGVGCSKQPSYGVCGCWKPEYCAGHALDGMVDVCSKKCAGDGCSKQPTYGVSGTRKREYCAGHALDRMICLSSSKYPKGRRNTKSKRGGSDAIAREDADEGYSTMPAKRMRMRKQMSVSETENTYVRDATGTSKGDDAVKVEVSCSTSSKRSVINATEQEDDDEGHSTLPVKRITSRKRIVVGASPAVKVEVSTKPPSAI